MVRSLVPFMALALVLPLAAPARAESLTAFDQRASLEWQTWTWANPAGTDKLTYSTPMTVFTIVDHTGAVFGAMRTVASNESRRRQAEDEAIRKGERRYTYLREEARPAEGSRFSFTVGQGGVSGTTGTGTAAAVTTGLTPTALMARIGLEGDIAEVLGGVFVFDAGIAYWTALAPSSGIRTNNTPNLTAWDWPLGLRWRYVAPFLPGLVIEPGINFNWLYTTYFAVNGGARWDARNMGVELGYHVVPQVKLRASYWLNRLAHEDVGWMKREDVVDMRNATLGVTLLF